MADNSVETLVKDLEKWRKGKYRILITCFTKGSAPDVSDMDDMRKKAWSFGWPLDIEAENETVFIRMETYGGAG